MSAIFAALALAAVPPAPAPLCQLITKQITAIEQEISDKSIEANLLANRLSPNRSSDEAAAYAQISANLAQLGLARCPAYPYPIDGRAYVNAAKVCRTAFFARTMSQTVADVPACDRSKWERSR